MVFDCTQDLHLNLFGSFWHFLKFIVIPEAFAILALGTVGVPQEDFHKKAYIQHIKYTLLLVSMDTAKDRGHTFGKHFLK